MSLIECPECKKSISSNAEKCIYCGMPLKTKKNKNVKTVLKLVIIIMLVLISVIGELNTPKLVYDYSIKEYEKGNYTKAESILKHLKFYGKAKVTLEQMPWEYKTFQCINNSKRYLKNPESIKVYEVRFYLSKSTKEDTLRYCYTSDIDAATYPAVVIKTSGTNSYGGVVSSYDLYLYSSRDLSYLYIGQCETLSSYLNEDSWLESDRLEAIYCKMIRKYMNESESIGNVNLDRVNRIIFNDTLK